MNPLFTNLTQETLAYLEDQLSNNTTSPATTSSSTCSSRSCR